MATNLNIVPAAAEPSKDFSSMARRRYQKGTVEIQNGRWTGRFTEDVRKADTTTRVHRRIFLGTVKEIPTKKLAMRQLEPFLAEINGVSYRPRTVMTVREFIPIWTPIAQPKYKPGTWRNFESALRTLLPHFGETQLSDVSTEMLERFMALQTKSGAHVRNLIKCFRAIWKSAKKWKYVRHDPFLEAQQPPINHEEPRFFTLQELLLILNNAPEPDRTLYWILAQTAVRIGEALALNWNVVDPDSGMILVRASVWRQQIQLPKTKASVRAIPISPKLAAHLSQFKQTAKPNPLNLLFVNNMFGGKRHAGRPCNADKLLEHRLQPLLEKLGIPSAGFHAFRHSSATLLDRMKAPMAVRQQRMGHTSSEMTSHYTHVLDEDARQVAAEFDQVLYPCLPENLNNSNEMLALAAGEGSKDG